MGFTHWALSILASVDAAFAEDVLALKAHGQVFYDAETKRTGELFSNLLVFFGCIFLFWPTKNLEIAFKTL